MIEVDITKLNLFQLEDVLWIIQSPVGVPNYDFEFKRYFNFQTVYQIEKEIVAVGRFGASRDYRQLTENLKKQKIRLINTPEESERAGLLSKWYPLIKEMTPRSKCYDSFPETSEILKEFDWPIFIKGDRQTAKHNKKLSIARNSEELEHIRENYRKNTILHWQSIVCREFIDLRKVGKGHSEQISPSFEYRFFFWKKHLVSAAPYWTETNAYKWTKIEEIQAKKLAQKAANILDIPFLVIDMAMTNKGDWIIIECNDAQESGYSANFPYLLWQRIIEIEKTI